MIKVYGASDSEKAFLKYLNSHMLQVELESLEDYQDFQKYPGEEKGALETEFEERLEAEKNRQSKAYNRNKTIFGDLKRINSKLFFKKKSVGKYWGKVKARIQDEINSLENQKRRLEREVEDNNNLIASLKSDIQTTYSEKKTALANLEKDIKKTSALNKDNTFTKLRQGAFGENNVIAHLKECFNKEKNCHLINGFDLDVFGKAINIKDHTLMENKLDHILLCKSGLFILETKAWKNFNSVSRQKVIDQLEKIETVFNKIFENKIDLSGIRIYLVSTEKYIPLEESSKFKSVKLQDIYKEISQSDEAYNNDDIALILNTFLSHMNEDHISGIEKTGIKVKALFVKTKRFFKR